jgi:hypothetical protein
MGHTAHPRLTILGVLHATYPTVTEAVLKALSLCENLYSFTWVDDTSAMPTVLPSFLKILRGLPLRALTVRTYSDPGEDAWAFLNTIPDLQKVAVWCMNGPPRVLQGWAPLLGSTLTELELGVRTDRTDHADRSSLMTHFIYYTIAMCRRPRDHFDRRTLSALAAARSTAKRRTKQCHPGNPHFAPRACCARHGVSPPVSTPPIRPCCTLAASPTAHCTHVLCRSTRPRTALVMALRYHAAPIARDFYAEYIFDRGSDKHSSGVSTFSRP